MSGVEFHCNGLALWPDLTETQRSGLQTRGRRNPEGEVLGCHRKKRNLMESIVKKNDHGFLKALSRKERIDLLAVP